MDSPDYNEDPERYKQLISQINGSVNFPAFLQQNGYDLIKQSAGSMEFQNEVDRIVLQTEREPTTYFNRNDSLDKGLFFKYLLQRSPNFYSAVQTGLEIIHNGQGLEPKRIQIKKTKTSPKSLEENFNIVPLWNSDYLRTYRGISLATLNSPIFKDRIFNAYHIRDTGGKIANTAFPKYDWEGRPKNYVLYNRPYRSRQDNQLKKFRLVVNDKDHYLFYSRPISDPARIVFGESAIDLLSYHELHGRSDNFYVSFGGNVYDRKLGFFVKLIEPMIKNKGIELRSIMDNDLKGLEFDIKVFSALINRFNPNISIETSFGNGKTSMNIHYSGKAIRSLNHHSRLLDEKLISVFGEEKPQMDQTTCLKLPDKLLLEFPLKRLANTVTFGKKTNALETIPNTINALYLPFQTSIHRSNGKDWNDDLRNFTEKRNEAIKENYKNTNLQQQSL